MPQQLPLLLGRLYVLRLPVVPRRLRLLVTAASLLAAPLACGGDSGSGPNPPPGPPPGQIVFEAAVAAHGAKDLYLMDGDGGHVTVLVADPAEDRSPALSRDGRQVAFTSTRGISSS